MARHVTMVRFEPAMLAGALLTGSSGWSAAYAAQAIARCVLASAFLHPHDVAINRVRAGGGRPSNVSTKSTKSRTKSSCSRPSGAGGGGGGGSMSIRRVGGGVGRWRGCCGGATGAAEPKHLVSQGEQGCPSLVGGGGRRWSSDAEALPDGGVCQAHETGGGDAGN